MGAKLGRVFGGSLPAEGVPAVLQHCCACINKEGLLEEGIFRRAGAASQIRKLREAYVLSVQFILADVAMSKSVLRRHAVFTVRVRCVFVCVFVFVNVYVFVYVYVCTSMWAVDLWLLDPPPPPSYADLALHLPQ
jgi:hypothetical protein